MKNWQISFTSSILGAFLFINRELKLPHFARRLDLETFGDEDPADKLPTAHNSQRFADCGARYNTFWPKAIKSRLGVARVADPSSGCGRDGALLVGISIFGRSAGQARARRARLIRK